jgi:Xaa-Pro aminopeptidase
MNGHLLQGVDAIFVTNPTNIRYLTGFVSVAPTERESYVLVTNDAVHLFTYGLYRETAETLLCTNPTATTGTPLRLVLLGKDMTITRALENLLSQTGLKRVGFEEKNCTVYELARFREKIPNTEFVPTNDRIESLRVQKNGEEIVHIRTAADLTDRCLSAIKPLVRPGITEAELVTHIETFFRHHGAENAFAPIVAFGKNTALPHYGVSHISQTPLTNDDIVLLDFGAKVNGYAADMTRMVFTGTPKPAWVAAYDAVLRANTKTISLLSDGERNGATLDAAAREIIAEADLPVYPHSLGHGVGLDVHEAPRLTVAREETLRPGMVVTVEPGVYIAGSFGIRIEDLINITADGITVLSKSDKKPLVI